MKSLPRWSLSTIQRRPRVTRHTLCGGTVAWHGPSPPPPWRGKLRFLLTHRYVGEIPIFRRPTNFALLSSSPLRRGAGGRREILYCCARDDMACLIPLQIPHQSLQQDTLPTRISNAPPRPTPNLKPVKEKEKTTNPPKKQRTMNSPHYSFFSPVSNSTSVATSSNSFNSNSSPSANSSSLPSFPPGSLPPIPLSLSAVGSRLDQLQGGVLGSKFYC